MRKLAGYNAGENVEQIHYIKRSNVKESWSTDVHPVSSTGLRFLRPEEVSMMSKPRQHPKNWCRLQWWSLRSLEAPPQSHLKRLRW